MTLEEVLNAYEADLRIRAKASSRRIAAVHCRTILRHGLGSKPADTICRLDVNLLIDKLRADGQRDTSINGVLRILRAALRLAGLDSPVKLLRETRKIPAVLDEAQLYALFAAAGTSQARLAMAIAAYGGLRKSEIEHLVWGDWDQTRGVLRVSAKKDWVPKSHAERDVPVSEKLRQSLYAHAPIFRAASAPPFASERVIEHSDTWDQVRAAFVAAGHTDPDLKPGLHMLRRTFASRLLQSGADIETVRELGGWADLATVQRYVASTTDLKRAAVERL